GRAQQAKRVDDPDDSLCGRALRDDAGSLGAAVHFGGVSRGRVGARSLPWEWHGRRGRGTPRPSLGGRGSAVSGFGDEAHGPAGLAVHSGRKSLIAATGSVVRRPRHPLRWRRPLGPPWTASTTSSRSMN